MVWPQPCRFGIELLQEVFVSDIAAQETPERRITGRRHDGERSWGRVARAWVGLALLTGLTAPLVAASPAVAHDNPAHHSPAHAYVANVEDDTVSVISTKTNTVTTTIPVGDRPSVWPSLRTVAAPTSPTTTATVCR